VPSSWFLKHHDWRRAWKENVRARIERDAVVRSLVPGEILFGGESPGGRVELIVEGRIRLCRFDAAGREILRAILEEGDLLVLEPTGEADPWSGYAEALESSRVLDLPLPDFLRLARSSRTSFQQSLPRARRSGGERG